LTYQLYRNLLWEYPDAVRLEWVCGYAFDDSASMSELRGSGCKLIGHYWAHDGTEENYGT